jgi:hypothetical protein
MEYSQLTYEISKILKVSPDFLQFPGIITNVIIPMIFFPYLLKNFIFDRALRGLFPDFIVWGLAIVISFASIFFVTFLGYPIAMGSIFYFCYNYISGHIKGIKGMVIGAIIGAIGVVIFLSIPTIISFVEYQIRIRSF